MRLHNEQILHSTFESAERLPLSQETEIIRTTVATGALRAGGSPTHKRTQNRTSALISVSVKGGARGVHVRIFAHGPRKGPWYRDGKRSANVHKRATRKPGETAEGRTPARQLPPPHASISSGTQAKPHGPGATAPVAKSSQKRMRRKRGNQANEGRRRPRQNAQATAPNLARKGRIARGFARDGDHAEH